MCGGGGGKAKEPQPTAADIAKMSFDESRLRTHAETFAPLEKEAVERAMDPAVENRERVTLRGRANADVMQAEKGDIQGMAATIGQGTGQVTLRDATHDSATMQSRGFKEADTQAQARQTQRMLNVARTGENLSRTALGGLRTQQNIANSAAINDMRIKNLERQSKAKAINTLVASGLKAGQMKQQQGFMNGMNTTDVAERVKNNGADTTGYLDLKQPWGTLTA